MKPPTLEEEKTRILNLLEETYPEYVTRAGLDDSPNTRINYYKIAIDELGKNYKYFPALVDQLIAALVRAINKQRKRLMSETMNNFRELSTPKE